MEHTRLGQPAMVAALREVPLFRRLAKATMFELVRRAGTVAHPAGSVLTKQGDPGDHLGVIMRGSARVESSGVTVAHLEAGDFFGEMSLIDGRPRSATVTATEDVVLMVVGAEDFDALLKIPYVARAVLEAMSLRIRELQDHPV